MVAHVAVVIMVNPENLLGREALEVNIFQSSISVFIWLSFMASNFAPSN